jgi:hypothetical protein
MFLFNTKVVKDHEIDLCAKVLSYISYIAQKLFGKKSYFKEKPNIEASLILAPFLLNFSRAH